MNNPVSQKVISLIFLLAIGFLFQAKFENSKNTSAIKIFVLNLALPASIFISTIDIKFQSDLLVLPLFALVVNIYLMIIGVYLSNYLISNRDSAKRRTLALLFPSLAPGLTIYPFLEQFSGKQGLALAALADMGNKVFVLVGLYGIAIYWYQKSSKSKNNTKSVNLNQNQWKDIAVFLLTEPVNIAIAIALILALGHLTSSTLLPAVSDSFQKLAACSTPLILIYVGLSLNLKSIQISLFIKILMVKAGAGFLFSFLAILILHPHSREMIMLLAALPQASFSFWPLLHAGKINNLDARNAIHSQKTKQDIFFDTEYATSLLAMSFPFSILVLLAVFANGEFLSTSPEYLGLFGVVILAFCGGISYPLSATHHPLQKFDVDHTQAIPRTDHRVFTRENNTKAFPSKDLLVKKAEKQSRFVSFTKVSQEQGSRRQT